MQQFGKKNKRKISKRRFYFIFMWKCYFFLRDLTIGMNTRAPEIRMVMTSIPSMRGEEVRTMKQSAAQNKASTTHCERVSGLRIRGKIKGEKKCACFSSG